MAAAEGKGGEMAANVPGNAVGELGVTVYLCVDLQANFGGEHGEK